MSRLDTIDFDQLYSQAASGETAAPVATTTAPATAAPEIDFDGVYDQAIGDMGVQAQQATAQQQAQQQEQQRIDVNLYVDQEASRLSVPVTVMEQMIGEGRGQTMDPMTGQARFGPLVGEELQELQQTMTERVQRQRTSVLGTQLHKIGMALGAPTHEQIAEREYHKYGGEWVRDATAPASEAFPQGGWRWQRYDKIDAQLKYVTDRVSRLGRLSELSYQGLVGTAAAGLEALRKFAKVSQALDPARLQGKGVGEVLADMKSRWDAKDTPYWLQHPMTAVQRWDQEHPPEVPLDNWIDFGSDIGAMFLELWLVGKTGAPTWVGRKAETAVKAGLRAPAVEVMRQTGSRIFAKEARAQQWIANLGKWMATIATYTAPANLRAVVSKELKPLEGFLHTVGAGPALIKDVNAGLTHYLTQSQAMTPQERAQEDVLAHRERISHLQPLGVVLALWAGHRYSAGRLGKRQRAREGEITAEREQVRQAIEAARKPAEAEARPKIPELVEKAKAEPVKPAAEPEAPEPEVPAKVQAAKRILGPDRGRRAAEILEGFDWSRVTEYEAIQRIRSRLNVSAERAREVVAVFRPEPEAPAEKAGVEREAWQVPRERYVGAPPEGTELPIWELNVTFTKEQNPAGPLKGKHREAAESAPEYGSFVNTSFGKGRVVSKRPKRVGTKKESAAGTVAMQAWQAKDWDHRVYVERAAKQGKIDWSSELGKQHAKDYPDIAAKYAGQKAAEAAKPEPEPPEVQVSGRKYSSDPVIEGQLRDLDAEIPPGDTARRRAFDMLAQELTYPERGLARPDIARLAAEGNATARVAMQMAKSKSLLWRQIQSPESAFAATKREAEKPPEPTKGAPAKAAVAVGMPAGAPELPTRKPAEQQAVVKNAQREIYESLRDMGTVARAFKSRAYLGQYRRTERIIEMVKTGNYSTAFHEIGHYVSDMWNEAMLAVAGKRPTEVTHGRERQPIWKSFDTESRKWLIQMGKALYGDKKPAGGYAEEGWAEFMRWWIADPVEALKLAPTDAIREAMGARLDQVFAKYPQLRKPMERLRENWRTLLEAEPEAVMDSQIVQDPRPPHGLFGRLTWWLQYRSAFTDTNAVIRQMEKEAGLTSEGATYKLFQKFTGGSSSGRAKFWMEDYVNSFTGEKRAESPKTILSRFKTGKEKRDFMRWIVALRALSREQRGQPMGFDIGPMAGKKLLRTIIQKYDSPEFREGAEQWRQMNDAMVDYVVDAGGLDPKIGQKIKDSDPVYVPFMRIFLEEARPVQAQGKGRGWVDLPKVVKRMKGTTHGRPILEPMHAMQLYVARLVQIADKTRAARSLSALVQHYPQLRRFFQPLHPYEIPKVASRHSLADLAEHLESRFGIVLGVEDQVGQLRAYGKAEGEALDQMLTIFTNSAVYFGKEPFVSVWQGGKQRWYKVDPLVHTALKGFDPLRLPRIVDVTVGGFNRWAKLAWTGLNPRFTFGTNPSRDIFQAAIATTAGRSPPRMFEEGGRVGLRFQESPDSMLRDILRENNFVMQKGRPTVWTTKATPEARGIAHRTTQLGRLRKYDPLGVGEFGDAIRKMVGGAEIWDLYKGQGLEFTQFLGGDLRSMDYQMRRVMSSTALQRANNIVDHPIEALRSTLLPTDAPSRLAEFERVLRRRGWEPGKPISESAIIEASYAAGEVTLPFNRAGWIGRYMNQWAAFTNPAIQAASKTVRLLGPEQALTTILRGVPLITVPAVVSWWWVKDRPEWKEKQSFLKAFFLNLPLSDEPGATIWSFPMPYELGWLFAGLPVTMLDAMYQDNPKRVTEWLGDGITTLVPEFVPTVARPWLDVLMNRKWTGAPIEPKWMEGLVPEARYNKYTPTLARLVSRVLGGAISPVQADHVLRGYGGWPLLNAGRYLHEAGVLVGLVPELPWVDYDRDIPVVGWFKRRAIGPGATSIRYFYDRLEVLRKKYQTLRAGRWQRQPPTRAELGEYRAMEKTARVLGELWREAREPKVERERLNLIYEEIVARTKKHVWNEVNGRARVVPPAGKGRPATNLEIMQGKIAELLVKDRRLKEQDSRGRGLRGADGYMLKELRKLDTRINKLLKVPVDQYDENAQRAERMAARAVRLIQRAESRQR